MDERIRTLIENGVRTKHRSMFVIIGDKSRDQVFCWSLIVIDFYDWNHLGNSI